MEKILENKDALNLLVSNEKYSNFKEILYKYYNEIADFYYTFDRKSVTDYLLFLSDESYTLYKFFQLAFNLYDKDYKNIEKCKVNNMNSLPELKEKLKENKNSRVRLCDVVAFDTNIFDKVQKELGEIIDEEKISKCCALIYGDKDINDQSFKNYRVVSRDEFQKCQNCIILLLKKSNIGVTSLFN